MKTVRIAGELQILGRNAALKLLLHKAEREATNDRCRFGRQRTASPERISLMPLMVGREEVTLGSARFVPGKISQ